MRWFFKNCMSYNPFSWQLPNNFQLHLEGYFMKLTARNLGACFIAGLLLMSGAVRRAKKRAMRGEYILSFYFHKPSKKEFETCVKWLMKNRFQFLSTDDIDRLIQNKIPFPKAGVVITVDDGWQSNETNIVEVVNRYRIPVTIFVSTAPVEEGVYWWSYWQKSFPDILKDHTPKQALKKVPNQVRLLELEAMKQKVFIGRDAMTIEQVTKAAASKYITIGGHTHTHPILTNCTDEEVYEELKSCKQKLASWTGKEVTCFAYPNGDYSKREMQVLKELGYHFAFCSNPKYFTPDAVKDRYALPRFGFLEGASFAENLCRITGVWKTFKQYFTPRFFNK